MEVKDMIQVVDEAKRKIVELTDRLERIERYALDQLDGDSPLDSKWSTIIRIAQADPW